MAGETVNFDEVTRAASPPEERERSTIVFPYLDLDAGVEVAAAIYRAHGLGACDLDHLAAELGQTVSGAFRLKTGTAKTFGLLEKDSRSAMKLSPLGRRIVLSDTAPDARAEAFLMVPLYSAIYEKYRGHLLPPAKALEREMAAFGVSSKQTDKARQAFERSARQAGFFWKGEDRLVRPKTETLPLPDEAPAIVVSPEKDSAKSGGGSGGGNGIDPLIDALIQKLPSKDEGKAFSIDDRIMWLQMMAMAFQMAYGQTDAISVEKK